MHKFGVQVGTGEGPIVFSTCRIHLHPKDVAGFLPSGLVIGERWLESASRFSYVKTGPIMVTGNRSTPWEWVVLAIAGISGSDNILWQGVGWVTKGNEGNKTGSQWANRSMASR